MREREKKKKCKTFILLVLNMRTYGRNMRSLISQVPIESGLCRV